MRLLHDVWIESIDWSSFEASSSWLRDLLLYKLVELMLIFVDFSYGWLYLYSLLCSSSLCSPSSCLYSVPWVVLPLIAVHVTVVLQYRQSFDLYRLCHPQGHLRICQQFCRVEADEATADTAKRDRKRKSAAQECRARGR